MGKNYGAGEGGNILWKKPQQFMRKKFWDYEVTDLLEKNLFGPGTARLHFARLDHPHAADAATWRAVILG